MAKNEAYILFSIVGSRDPIAYENAQDGALLHICRHYRPKIVIMYFSKTMLDNHNKDDRYRRALNLLCEKQGRKAYWIEKLDEEDMSKDIAPVYDKYDVIFAMIQKPDLVNVHEMDDFYPEFKKYFVTINRLKIDIHEPKLQLLFNISSGTPGMKSALHVLSTLDTSTSKCVQVVAPTMGGVDVSSDIKKAELDKNINCSIEELWIKNKDNEEGAEKRVREPRIDNLILLRYEGILKDQLKNYNYAAAQDLIRMDEIKEQTARYSELIDMAYYRSQLKTKEAMEKAKQHSFSFLSLENEIERNYFEFALCVYLKLKRGEFADFIRALTPIIFWIFEKILDEKFGLKIDVYCMVRNKKRIWDRDKLNEKAQNGDKQAKEIKKILTNTKNDDVWSWQLEKLIGNLNSNQEVKDLIRAIRKIESNVRNKAAHNVVAITDVEIKELTGFSSEEIMDKIRESFEVALPYLKQDDKLWDSYDDMNKKIIEFIENN